MLKPEFSLGPVDVITPSLSTRGHHENVKILEYYKMHFHEH